MLIPVLAFSQKDTSYTYIGNSILGQDSPKDGAIETANLFNSITTVDYAILSFVNLAVDNNRNKKALQKLEEDKRQSILKLENIKTQYLSYSKYPDSISDGWHSIVVTDNSLFCKDAKVLIKANKIQKFVIDNYIPVNFTPLGKIAKSKTKITLKNFNGQQLNILDIYFLYDIDEQVIVDPPIEPGYICFWTDSRRYDQIQVILDTYPINRFTVEFDKEPNCFADGMVVRILKPGRYSYRALKHGTDHKGDFIIKSGYCLKHKVR